MMPEPGGDECIWMGEPASQSQPARTMTVRSRMAKNKNWLLLTFITQATTLIGYTLTHENGLVGQSLSTACV
jgi:hypothetical protein